VLIKELLNDLQEFVDSRLLACPIRLVSERYALYKEPICENIESDEMEDFILNNRKPSFNKLLFKHIDTKGVSDSEIYKKAGIDRRHFSKIRSNPDYHPSKNTAIAFALALELDYKEAIKLIQAAGYALSDSETFDLVITFCFERKIYNISDVNLALDYFSLKPLVGALE
jgi:hypothetical protein